MYRQNLRKNNKGATLVLVIVAMMFVGIIASIVLTITVGNAKSTRTTIENSEKFYTSESVLDDFEMYLKKLASQAAVSAYAQALQTPTGGNKNTTFQSAFKSELLAILNGTDGGIFNYMAPEPDLNVTRVGDKIVIKSSFISSKISDRPGTIEISFDYSSFNTFAETATGKPTLKNVEIKYSGDGFESSITTNIEFAAKYPDNGELTKSKRSVRDIDHFVIISGKDINPKNSEGTVNNLYLDATGNIYAYHNVYLKSNTDLVDEEDVPRDVKIKTQYMIAKNDIIVDDGIVSIEPVNDTDIIAKITTSGTIDDSVAIPAEVWCDDFQVENSGNVTTENSGTETTNVNLKGNLELNGNAASYKAVGGGEINGFSSETDAVLIREPKSSAIIVNGLGAKLDLAGLTRLRLEGTAYSALSTIDGLSSGAYAAGEDPNSSTYQSLIYGDYGVMGYFTQGESVTFRTLQAIYLIPGDYVSGVGHNPMKESEYSDGMKINLPTEIYTGSNENKKCLVDEDEPYTKQIVRYSGTGESYVYLFWNFSEEKTTDEEGNVIVTRDKIDSAVTYYNNITAANKRYGDLKNKQLDIIGQYNGSISLPDTCLTKGNAVQYTSSGYINKDVGTPDVRSLANDYNSLVGRVDKSNENVSSSIFASMFGDKPEGTTDTKYEGKLSSLVDTMANEEHVGLKLIDPYKALKINGKTGYYKESKAETFQETEYRLITGPNVTFTPQEGITYVVITPGNCTINGGTKFRGIIIAEGNVILPTSTKLEMECMGIISRTAVISGTGAGTGEQATKYEKEFRALIEVSDADGDETSGNYILRSIFGIVGSENEEEEDTVTNDFVSVNAVDWDRKG